MNSFIAFSITCVGLKLFGVQIVTKWIFDSKNLVKFNSFSKGFFVSSEKQGKGYGKKLLDHCDKYAMENDLTTVVLMTNKYMPAYNFYNKIGYTATEQYVFMFKQVV